jgi:hypothetical protein
MIPVTLLARFVPMTVCFSILVQGLTMEKVA